MSVSSWTLRRVEWRFTNLFWVSIKNRTTTWDIDFVINECGESVDENEEEPEVWMWIVVTHTYLICWESRYTHDPITCTQQLFELSFTTYFYEIDWNQKNQTVCTEKERERETKQRGKKKFLFQAKLRFFAPKKWTPAKKWIQKHKKMPWDTYSFTLIEKCSQRTEKSLYSSSCFEKRILYQDPWRWCPGDQVPGFPTQ